MHLFGLFLENARGVLSKMWWRLSTTNMCIEFLNKSIIKMLKKIVPLRFIKTLKLLIVSTERLSHNSCEVYTLKKL